MTFWEVVFAIFVGGLLVASTIGYCLFIAWKWVLRDVMKSIENGFQAYYNAIDTIKED